MSGDIKDMDDMEAQVWGLAYACHGHAVCLRDDERCRAVDFADEAVRLLRERRNTRSPFDGWTLNAAQRRVVDAITPLGEFGPWKPVVGGLTSLCSVCDEPQFASPGGRTCPNGHGGAPAKEEP